MRMTHNEMLDLREKIFELIDLAHYVLEQEKRDAPRDVILAEIFLDEEKRVYTNRIDMWNKIHEDLIDAAQCLNTLMFEDDCNLELAAKPADVEIHDVRCSKLFKLKERRSEYGTGRFSRKSNCVARRGAGASQ